MPGPNEGVRASASGVFSASAWRIGRVSGIEIAIDHSWLLIFFLVSISLSAYLGGAVPGVPAGQRWAAALVSSALGFTSIVLHELGHSLVAQAFGLRVRSITLFLFGGVAQLESEPRKPAHELWIALAGPAVSIALGAGALALAGLAPDATLAHESLAWLGRMNLALGIFNLAPGFPLDGGRVLRAIVWAITGDFARATRTAARAGAAVAFVLIALGTFVVLSGQSLVSGLWFVLLGWFLLSAARSAAGSLELERVLGHARVADLLEPVARARVSTRDSVADVVGAHVLRHGLRTLYATEPDGRLLGIVTLRELAAVPPERRESTPIEAVMVPVARTACLAPGETGLAALRRLAGARVNQLPVLDQGRLVGVLTRERLFALLETELRFGAAASRAEHRAA